MKRPSHFTLTHVLFALIVIGGLYLAGSRIEAKSASYSRQSKVCGRTVPRAETRSPVNTGSLDEFFASTDVPKSIPDGPTGVVTSFLDVESTDTVRDLNVQITITHTWIRDLQITLVSPDLVEVLLLDLFPADSIVNMTDCVFDDEAADSIEQGLPPFTGSYRPDSSLTHFDGHPMQGRWTLRVRDQFPEDTGSIVQWGLNINPVANLQGVVRKSANNRPLSGVIVKILGAGLQDTTTTDGLYELSSVPTGNYTVEFSKLFYDTLTLENIRIRNDSLTELNALMTTPFTTIDYTATGPVPIPDQETAVLSIEVTDSLIIADLDITVNVQHTYAGDLAVILIGPGNRTVLLSDSNVALSDSNYINCRFDDEAAISITEATPPFTGTWRPRNPLTHYDGYNTAGTWQLMCRDHFPADTGQIVDFTLHFTGTSIFVSSERPALPQAFEFLGNFPNPFNNETTFQFELARSSQVKLSLFNVLGQEVAVPLNQMMVSGLHNIPFDGSKLTSGIYFARLSVSGVDRTRKLVLLK